MSLLSKIPRFNTVTRAALLASALATLITAPLLAAEKQPATDQSARYERCQSLVDSDAKAALQQAQAWRKEDSSVSAMDCEALALVALKRYAEGADILATLAANKAVDSGMRVQLYDQAGNAWLLAAEPGKALLLFSAALAIAPHDIDNLTDRARARAMHGDWNGAETDLTLALGQDPERADLLVLRASAYHAMGKKTEALADIEHALTILPDYPEALLQRGTIRLENGDIAGARSDWQILTAKSPETSQGEAAKERLAQLDATPAAKPKPVKKR